jgi:diguanylate cyclase (GGDEF)-like protein/PAS domain S-box-containing protein
MSIGSSDISQYYDVDNRKFSLEDLDIPTEFLDVTRLCLQWVSATLYSDLPSYEDVALGGVGRIADELALLRPLANHDFEFVRAGAALEAKIGQAAKLRVSDLPLNYRLAFESGSSQAISQRRPILTLARCAESGLIATCEILAMPLASRWGGEFVLAFMRQRPSVHDLIEAIYTATTDGILALASARGQAGQRDFQVVSLNGGAAGFFGRAESEILWKPLSEVLPHSAAGDLYRIFDEVVSSGRPRRFEHSLRMGAERSAHLSLSAAPIRDLLSVTFTDISEIKIREDSVKLLFENNPCPLFLYDPENLAFVRVNHAAVQHYGYARERFVSMTLRDLHPADEHDRLIATAKRIPQDYQANQYWTHITRDGARLNVLIYARRLMFEGRSCVLASIVDVTAQRRAEARIEHMAHHDALTSLANRVLFRARLEEELEKIPGAKGHLAVHSIDLDYFKRVNDTLGHSVGDDVLRAVASRLKSAARGSEVIARLGGDEFAILQANVASPEEAAALAQRLIESLSAPYKVNGQMVVIGASIGISLAPTDGSDPSVLIKNSDIALYEAKKNGRGAYHFFEAEMDAKLQQRRAFEVDLRLAFQNGEFEVHYQPIIDVASAAIIGCEALLRWRHAERGAVPPGAFIPLAEEIGLIVPIGEWVLNQACREAAQWRDEIRVAVNLSPVQFRDAGLVAAVKGALAASGLDARRLELEITESVLLEETEANLATLGQLQALGISISLDDFGTGYSSLSYLRTFHFDKIKIDRSFVADIALNSPCLAIVRAVINLGTSLGIKTVAEGVETQDQLAGLQREGCSQVQGYLFSAAVPGAIFRKMLPPKAKAEKVDAAA